MCVCVSHITGAFHLEGLDAAAKVVDPASLMYVYEGYANLVATNKAAKVRRGHRHTHT